MNKIKKTLGMGFIILKAIPAYAVTVQLIGNTANLPYADLVLD